MLMFGIVLHRSVLLLGVFTLPSDTLQRFLYFMLLFHSPLQAYYLNNVYGGKNKSLKKVLEWLKDLKCTQNVCYLTSNLSPQLSQS